MPTPSYALPKILLEEPIGFLEQLGKELGIHVFLGEKEKYQDTGFSAPVEDVDGRVLGTFYASHVPFSPAAYYAYEGTHPLAGNLEVMLSSSVSKPEFEESTGIRWDKYYSRITFP